MVGGNLGGVARFLVDLASRPDTSVAEHCIALMTPDQRLRDLFNAAGLEVRDRGYVGADPLSYLRFTFGPADVAWLERTLFEEGADLVHIHTFKAHVIGARAALRRGVPILRTEHGVDHYADPSCILFRRWALRQVDCVVAVSEFVARFVEKAAREARGKIRVIRNGVDTTHFRAHPPPIDGPFTFSVVCRLEPWKQVDFILQAVARLPQVRLVVAGDGSARGKLEGLARKLRIDDRVAFVGFQPEPRPVLARSDASINSSRDEPLGLAVLEALATQRPVVAFDGGGIPEIVKDGQTGWLVADRSVDALTARMAEASSSRVRAAALGANGRAFVERQCGIDDMCRGYARVYADLAALPRRSHAAAH